MLEALAGLSRRHPRTILIVAGVFLAASMGVVVHGGRLTGGDIAGLEAGRAEALVEEVVGASPDTTVIAVFSYPALADDPGAARRAIERALAPLRDDPRVRSVTTPATAPAPLRARMVNDRAHAAYALIALDGTFTDALAAYPDVRRAIVVDDGVAVALTGRVPFHHDLDRMLERDLMRAELVALPVAVLVLLLVFQTAVAAILPVAVGALAVLGGLAIVLALSHVVAIATYTINIATLIGLGVAIDYSLFMVNRYREELADGHDAHDALVRTMRTTGRVVAFSGLAVGTGLCGLFFFQGSYLVSMGLGGAVVVGLAVLFALTVLPALLTVLGPTIHAGRLPRLRLGFARGALERTLAWVLDHPWRVLVVTGGLLIVIGTPFLHLRLAGIDASVLPAEAEARRAQAVLHDAFADLARNRIVVAVEFPTAPALTRERIGALYDLSRRIAAIPGVAHVESVVDAPRPLSREAYQQVLLAPPTPLTAELQAALPLLVGDRAVLLYALTDLPPESEAAARVVEAIRATRAVGDGALVVGGQTAADLDSEAFMVARAPRAVAFVVGVTLVVLFATFRSVVLPIKAVLLNFLSIAGSFGALVWVFQDGHLFVDHPRPIEPSVPILLFCIVFGLSMDYHVLMLSRIREAYRQHPDNRAAVAAGLARSARLITAAAAIMVTVFGAFALARFVVIRSIGFGMALAVALDATIVRLLLVPSSMTLLGRWNWWAPRWLRRRRDGAVAVTPGAPASG